MGGAVSSPEIENSNSEGKSSSVMAIRSAVQWRAHFDASKETNQLMVIDFTATWCRPCRLMDSTIKEFAAKYTDVQFIKIDVDELAEVSRQFEVQALPTFVLVKNGKVLEKIVGTKREELQKKIEKHRK